MYARVRGCANVNGLERDATAEKRFKSRSTDTNEPPTRRLKLKRKDGILITLDAL
jgi:hypothetical protein